MLRRMGGLTATQKFARFFLLPGVDHSVQGPGPVPTALVETLVSRVEEGKAVGMLRGEQRDQSGKVIRTRPLFPYPRVAKYRGRGNKDDAASHIQQPSPWRATGSRLCRPLANGLRG